VAAKTLSPIRKSSFGKIDLSREREWVLQHGQEYVGQWIVLVDGRLIGHTANGDELVTIVDRVRAEGIRAPYVEFVSGESEPIWMGWL
jgi:hypothetical protein